MVATPNNVEAVEGTPMCSIAQELPTMAGVEEEWFFGGTATSYRLVGGGITYASDGRWSVEPADRRRFRTRMIVLRPAEPSRFNGTVIVNWNNVTAGESFERPMVAARLVSDGFALVGVSAQRVGVEGAGDSGPWLPSLKTEMPDRYRALEHPGDDFSYDIFTQAVSLLGPRRSTDPDPLRGLSVRKVIATGGSQSGARLMTYINAVRPLESAIDGFLVTVIPNTPCALNHESAPAELPQASGPNRFDMLESGRYQYRDDLAVPVIVLNSESEASSCFPNIQPDLDHLRVWDVAGTGHAGVIPHGDPGVAAIAGIPRSEVSFAPAKRGAIHALHRWIEDGLAPPSQPRIDRDPATGSFVRDQVGNAVGGIRWPELEAPLATHRGEPVPGGAPFWLGLSTPLPDDAIRALYPNREHWLARYRAAVDHLVATQVIVPADADEMMARTELISLPM